MQCLLSLNDCLMVGSVQINVLEVRHDSVTLGIDDPNACPTYREEILYLGSDDDDADFHGEDANEESFPYEFESYSPFAIPVL